MQNTNIKAPTSPMRAPIVTPVDRPIEAPAPEPKAKKEAPVGKPVGAPFTPEEGFEKLENKRSNFKQGEKPIRVSGYRKQLHDYADDVLKKDDVVYGVRVEKLEIFKKDDPRRRMKMNRETQFLSGLMGEITFRVQPGYMTWRIWDDANKKFHDMDFAGYDFDYNRDDMEEESQSGRIFERRQGEGLMKLKVVRSKYGKIHVILPTERDQSGNKQPAIRTMTERSYKPHSDNNDRLKAGLEAFVRIREERFEWEHPLNRPNNYGAGCHTCQHSRVAKQHDGISEDFEGKISQKATNDLTEDGQYTPKYYCSVFDEFKDEPIKNKLNQSNAQDWKGQYVEKTNRYGETYYRLKQEGEEVVGGVAMDPQSHIEHELGEIAEGCTYFHKQQFKEESEISRDKTKVREAHGLTNADVKVDTSYKESAKPERAIIDTEVKYNVEYKVREDGTLTDEQPKRISSKKVSEMEETATTKVGMRSEWVTQVAPYQMAQRMDDAESEVEQITAFRVRTLDGVTVTGSDEVMKNVNIDDVITAESVDERLLKFHKRVTRFHQAANNIYALDDLAISRLSYVALNLKPSWVTEYQSEKWDKAVDRFIARGEELMLAQEDEKMVPEETLEEQWADV